MEDLGPVPIRIQTDEDLVRSLIAAQFPQWAGLPVRRVANEGWDNQTFHLGDEMSVRLPSAAEYALAVAKEHRWLPVLAPQLPVPVPVPLAQGVPGEGYPHPWSVYRWLGGAPAERQDIADLTGFALSVAEFLTALNAVDPTDGPPAGLHNWYRGGSLAMYDGLARDALKTLEVHMDIDPARQAWDTALQSSWDGPPVWFHGDIALGNLLLANGALCAVIDFGTCGVGDPACDLAIAWTVFSGSSREAFQDRLSFDPATWARGRGWALWKALVGYADVAGTDDPDAPETRRTLDRILT